MSQCSSAQDIGEHAHAPATTGEARRGPESPPTRQDIQVFAGTGGQSEADARFVHGPVTLPPVREIAGSLVRCRAGFLSAAQSMSSMSGMVLE